MRIIRYEDEEYKCYEEVDSSIIGYEEINESLNAVRNFSLSLLSIAQNKLSVSVYTYECDGINAFAIKQNDGYSIAISINTFVELKRWFSTWLSYKETYDALDLKYREKETLLYIMYHYSLLFLAAHECFHVLWGHCDCPNYVGKFLFEQSRQIQGDNSLFCQSLEMSADCGAISACIVNMVKENESKYVWEEKMKILLFSAYSVFKLFSEYEHYDFEHFLEEELYKYDHPYAGIRFEIITMAMNSAIKYLKKEDLNGNIRYEYIRFEKEILNVESLKEMFVSPAYTLKGTKHINELLNKWNSIRGELEEFAYAPLMKWEINGNPIVLIDDEGGLIRCTGGTLNSESV